ncbi:hypothetical protein MPTK1_7g10150 [Marchantia polymorpha subsp. ruderalis]|uniref:Uncharacterized protein n=2 Tax=Marchantia polymorpha TaxID=3197 RepID=A0AAF6BY05_MARPO|nr:hypothetical protein MARPO_0003s0034 [Marchantia polymorpha]PTQ49130.1 hypothetical protein MARPO_0003s0034 [Marchantia polymorpha]BBN16889.1 hypothetical protein Mp_7g10150 [Marchantia polymorpha subsp. ruderalis]BBN16890.1 hypothetical protein Mp_7g10150 [Marchantia polymorpha subsp. ruderalis]|eukprot:PTQ49129.1 hypothetical protein MARPO_0003s0034 [Marchantia polymorpha]
MASMIRLQVPHHSYRFLQEMEKVRYRLGSAQKSGTLCLPISSHDHNRLEIWNGLENPTICNMERTTSPRPNATSTGFHDRAIPTFGGRQRRSPSMYFRHQASVSNYFESFEEFRVTGVSIHTAPANVNPDVDPTWFGLDSELPGPEDESQKVENMSIVFTDVVPVVVNLRNLWLRIDFKLSKNGVNRTVSYMDFNRVYDFGWIDGKRTKVETIVAHLKTCLWRGEDAHVVKITTHLVHGYFYGKQRWFGLMQMVLRVGSTEIILGDKKYHVGTGPWPEEVPYKYGYQGSSNTWFGETE